MKADCPMSSFGTIRCRILRPGKVLKSYGVRYDFDLPETSKIAFEKSNRSAMPSSFAN